MSRYVLDSSVLVGLVDARDKWHTKAGALADKMAEADLMGIFFDCVVNESISVICRRLEEKGRANELGTLLEKINAFAPKEEIVWVSGRIEELYDEIIALVKKSNGELNFHDALIALTAKEMGIYHIVSFDQDFDQVAWLTRIGDEADL